MGSVIITFILVMVLAGGLESLHVKSQTQRQNLVRTSRLALSNGHYFCAENKLQRETSVDPEDDNAKQLLS